MERCRVELRTQRVLSNQEHLREVHYFLEFARNGHANICFNIDRLAPRESVDVSIYLDPADIELALAAHLKHCGLHTIEPGLN